MEDVYDIFMAGGRPTDYDEDFHCKSVIEHGKNGDSVFEIAKDWDVVIQTIYNWAAAHK